MSAGSPDKPALPPAGVEDQPFWRKPLASLTIEEWERLCDGCGRCCLVKLEDEDTGEIYYTDVTCRLLDAGTCRCGDYLRRQEKVADCVRLTPEMIDEIGWLPSTCAYRLRAEGRDLMWWHPLVSGRAESVREAGVSVSCHDTASEDDVLPQNLQARIAAWPKRWPKRARKAPGGSPTVTLARPRRSRP